MKLTKTEVMELQRQADARTGRADSARHARLILLLSEGLTWAEIRTKLDCSDSYIDRWSKRFAADRLAGLFARHAGRERYKLTDRIEARVLAWTTKRKPADGSTHWSSRKLAAELGGAISHMMVARIWAKHNLKPHRLEGSLASNDPDFESKAADVIGLYLNPPQRAAVFSVDEKTGIQAIERKHADRAPRPARARRQEFEYIRHGTQALTAAFDVHSGCVLGRCTDRRTQDDLVVFMEEVARAYPKGRVHVVWDNLNTHRAYGVWKDFNARHGGRFIFHFTPLHASWVNQIELLFATYARRVLRHTSHTSIAHLRQRTQDFIAQRNRSPKPFKWTFAGFELQTGEPKRFAPHAHTTRPSTRR